MDELPPCFVTWCDRCNWKGHCDQGYFYVVGVNYPIIDSGEEPARSAFARCRNCGVALRRDCSLVALTQRFRRAAEHFMRADVGRPSPLFPCSCFAFPPCELVGGVEVAMSIMGDTCFAHDGSWVRTVGVVRCRGCFAATRAALVEHHHPLSVERYSEAAGRYVPAWVI